MATPKDRPLQCRPAKSSEWSAALECWFGTAPSYAQQQSLIYQLEHDAGFADGLWIAVDGARIIAVMWVLPGFTSSAFCWPMRCNRKHDEHERSMIVKKLWHEVGNHYRSLGVRHFQVNVQRGNEDFDILQRVGFLQVATLQRMRLDFIAHYDRLYDVRLIRCHEHEEKTFDQTMIDSLEGTLDVPELNQLQSPQDVLAQFAKPEVGRFLIEHSQHGVLGVAACAIDGEVGYLRYLGIKQFHRQQGWGQAGLLSIQEELRRLSCRTMELRVDTRNLPAIKLYSKLGYRWIDEEVMLIAE